MTNRSDLQRRLTLLLFQAMGLAAVPSIAAGCGGNVVVDKGSGGSGGTGAGGTSAGGTGGVGGATTTNTCSATGGGKAVNVCVPLEGDYCPPGTSATVLQTTAKQLGLCAETSPGNCCNQANVDKVLCDQAPTGSGCCYTVEVQDSGLCVGRPFTVDGAARAAGAVARSDWSTGDLPDCEALDAVTRAALARAWSEDAALEHASVASFARLSLELLGVGAPPDLLAGAQQAMGDEIRHAQLSYAIAGAYAGSPIGPAPLRIEGSLRETTLAALAADTVREGCIGETIAALMAAEAAETATDPAVKHALASIAEEESEHAALAFRIAAWAYRTGDSGARAAIEAAFQSAAAPLLGDLPGGVDPAVWQQHGRLPPCDLQSLAAEALSGVIVPAFEALRAEALA